MMQSGAGVRGASGTPPFRDRMRQVAGGAPSSSPTPFQGGGSQHQNYTPGKISKQAVPKPPKQPEKPLMPYMRYSRKVWDSVKAKNVELKLWEIGKIIGQSWRDLPDAEKKEYNEAYEADKVQYQENMKLFHNSPAYQNYLREKQRAENQAEEEERRSKSVASNEHRVSLQPSDYDNEVDSSLSERHVSAARYHRNHVLINEIFSDTMVPDGRSVVTEQRMNILKKQVTSLMEHQQKLERELGDITKKFDEKKKKFLDSSDEFAKKLKVECENKPVMTSPKFDLMVRKHKAELRVKYEKMMEQQKIEQERALAAQAKVQQHIKEQQAAINEQLIQQAAQQATQPAVQPAPQQAAAALPPVQAAESLPSNDSQPNLHSQTSSDSQLSNLNTQPTIGSRTPDRMERDDSVMSEDTDLENSSDAAYDRPTPPPAAVPTSAAPTPTVPTADAPPPVAPQAAAPLDQAPQDHLAEAPPAEEAPPVGSLAEATPVIAPPMEATPVVTPPAQDSPAVALPTEAPPTEAPQAETPPALAPHVETPPATLPMDVTPMVEGPRAAQSEVSAPQLPSQVPAMEHSEPPTSQPAPGTDSHLTEHPVPSAVDNPTTQDSAADICGVSQQGMTEESLTKNTGNTEAAAAAAVSVPAHSEPAVSVPAHSEPAAGDAPVLKEPITDPITEPITEPQSALTGTEKSTDGEKPAEEKTADEPMQTDG